MSEEIDCAEQPKIIVKAHYSFFVPDNRKIYGTIGPMPLTWADIAWSIFWTIFHSVKLALLLGVVAVAFILNPVAFISAALPAFLLAFAFALAGRGRN